MKNIPLLFVVFILLVSCGGLSDAGKILRNEKVKSTDEFLVKKKNPLELPPSYGDLPEPSIENKGSLEDSIDEDIEKIIKNVSEEDNLEIISDDKSAEDFVLKEIKNN